MATELGRTLRFKHPKDAEANRPRGDFKRGGGGSTENKAVPRIIIGKTEGGSMIIRLLLLSSKKGIQDQPHRLKEGHTKKEGKKSLHGMQRNQHRPPPSPLPPPSVRISYHMTVHAWMRGLLSPVTMRALVGERLEWGPAPTEGRTGEVEGALWGEFGSSSE